MSPPPELHFGIANKYGVLACVGVEDLNCYPKMLVRIGRTPAADKCSKLLPVSLQGGSEFVVERMACNGWTVLVF